MKTVLRIGSFAGLGLMFTASGLLFAGDISRGTYTTLALVGTGAWFLTVPFWMKRRLHQEG